VSDPPNDPRPRRPFHTLQRGDRIPPFTLRISTEQVHAYLDATGEQHAAWDRYVPPLAIGALVLGGLMERAEVPATLLHTGQEYDFRRPVELSITVASRSERAGTGIVALEAEWRVGGDVAGTSRSTVLLGPPAGDPT
jgi:hypothetical protein